MSIMNKIRNFFKRFKRNNHLLNEENVNLADNKKEAFINSVDIKGMQEYINLQTKLENKQISIDDLSIFEVMELIKLYEGQLNNV